MILKVAAVGRNLVDMLFSHGDALAAPDDDDEDDDDNDDPEPDVVLESRT